jgi:hypothetical protein
MKTTIYRYALRATGLLMLLGLINWFLIARPLGYTASEIFGYLSMILSLSMIFFAIRHFRAQHGNGTVSFGQGFRIGILITLITSVIFFVYTVVYFAIWGDSFKVWAYEHFKATMSSEQYQEFLTQMQQPFYNSPAFQGLVMFLTVFFIGLIISLISATALKKG